MRETDIEWLSQVSLVLNERASECLDDQDKSDLKMAREIIKRIILRSRQQSARTPWHPKGRHEDC
jgi:hypothetical protein